MLHVKYFCKKTFKRKNSEKIQDNCKFDRFVSDQKFIEDPSELSSVNTQLNHHMNFIHNNSSSFSSSSLSPFSDLINDQKNLFYDKYMQNLNKFINNSINATILQHQVKTSVNAASVYSIPSLMSSIINNNRINNKLEDTSTTRKLKKFEQNTHIDKKKSGNSSKIRFINLKSNSERIKNIELITSSALNLQNCCANCNAQFRMTSDLVYHMRTFHRRDDSSYKNKLKIQTKELKLLKCDICNESFKEKHHLTRHMTSHR